MWDRDCTRKVTLAIGLLAAAACGNSPEVAMPEGDKVLRMGAMVEKIERQFPEVPRVDAEAVRRGLAAGNVVLVDSRSAVERAVSTIPGALSREEFERRADEFAGSPVVTYCTIGYRSSEYAAELRRSGWDASNFRGSLLAWTHAGGPLVDAAGQPTRRLHVFGERWDLAADGYETVW